MPFVVDASISAVWLLADESDPTADAAYDRLSTDHAVVPYLWWFEVRNLLITNERRGRLDADAVRRALVLLSALPIRFDTAPGADGIIDLARSHRLTVYDAAYLELAIRKDLPLATLDRALIRVAEAMAVPLVA